MPYIIEDTYSHQDRSRLWARAGTEVLIISGNHGTSVVQPVAGGEKFVVHDEEMTDDPKKCKTSFALNSGSAPEQKAKSPKPSPPNRNDSPQTSLF